MLTDTKALNDFARGQMLGESYIPNRIWVDIRFLKDWYIGAVVHYRIRHLADPVEIQAVAERVQAKAISPAYQSRRFDDPALLDITDDPSDVLTKARLIEYIESLTHNQQMVLLYISPVTSFTRLLAGRTLTNLNHSTVMERASPITHTLNVYPFNNTEDIKRLCIGDIECLLCTKVKTRRTAVASSPISVYKDYDHIYIFDLAEFFQRKDVRLAFTHLTQIEKWWSFAGLFGSVVGDDVKAEQDANMLIHTLQCSTSADIIPADRFVPIFPGMDIETITEER